MPSFKKLLEEKNQRLEDIPLALQTTVQKQQKKVISQILTELGQLSTSNGEIKITSANLKLVIKISEELKSIFLNTDYLKAVKTFAGEFDKQAKLNDKIIKEGFGSTDNPIAAKIYLDQAKKNAVDALTYENAFIRPVQEALESAVVNGSTITETIEAITLLVDGNEEIDSRILKYVRQITNDSFAIADRSYTSIVSDALDNEWYYYAGSEVAGTRCFCKERVGNYYHYKNIEAWGRGEDLGDCNIGDGTWQGEIYGTNESTIYSYLGGYNCMHSIMPVSESIVPESDMDRAKSLGYVD